MDLSDLLIFKTVADEGGILRAATRLHRVQSNVTTRMPSQPFADAVATSVARGGVIVLFDIVAL